VSPQDAAIGYCGAIRADSSRSSPEQKIWGAANQLDRAHRDFTHTPLEFLTNVVRLYRGRPCEFKHGSAEKIRELFACSGDLRSSPDSKTKAAKGKISDSHRHP
jgi:hypothetical protein